MMDKQDKYIDRIYNFQGKWEMPSLCGLKIFNKDHDSYVVLTELYTENTGSSVTEMILPLATKIVGEYSLDPEQTVFIVRNPERSTHYEFFAETFHKAGMIWDGSSFCQLVWERLEVDDFEELLEVN